MQAALPHLTCCTIDAHIYTSARFTSTGPGMGETRHFARQPPPSDGRNSDQHVSAFILPTGTGTVMRRDQRPLWAVL